MTDKDLYEDAKKEHERLVANANRIFSALEYRRKLSIRHNNGEDLNESEMAELYDYGKDIARVVGIEKLGKERARETSRKR